MHFVCYGNFFTKFKFYKYSGILIEFQKSLEGRNLQSHWTRVEDSDRSFSGESLRLCFLRKLKIKKR